MLRMTPYDRRDLFISFFPLYAWLLPLPVRSRCGFPALRGPTARRRFGLSAVAPTARRSSLRAFPPINPSSYTRL